MNVNELVESGARVDISFHDSKNLNEAYNKISPFKHLGEIKMKNYNGSYWVRIETEKVQITAFYKNRRTEK